MSQQLTDLIDSLIATEEHPTAWAWSASDEFHSDYIDCSPAWDSDTKTHCTDLFSLEVGGGEVSAVILDLTIDDLREIHRKLTIQLAVIARQQQN